jgi:hypothetical protein
MSHDAQAPSGAAGGDQPIAVSAGIANGVLVLIVGGLALAIMQGFFVAESSGFGRVWPAADSVKVQLPPSNF